MGRLELLKRIEALHMNARGYPRGRVTRVDLGLAEHRHGARVSGSLSAPSSPR